MTERKCKGSCDRETDTGHVGEVKLVNVSDGTIDWGDHWYCDTAIARDRANGFTVTIIKEATND